MRRRFLDGRWPIYLLLLVGLGISLLPLGTTTRGRGKTLTFDNGFSVSGRFSDAWQSTFTYRDSILINGYPISEVRDEINPDDGNVYKVQWFERARFEEHPDEKQPRDVQLGRLGAIAAAGREGEPPFLAVPQPANLGDSLVWFPESKHTINEPFLTFWRDHGELLQFGFPISEPFAEPVGPAGQILTVQYFERARFELHTDSDGAQQVLLSNLGVQQIAKAVVVTPAPTAVPTPMP